MNKKLVVFMILSILFIVVFPNYKNKVLDKKYKIQITVEESKNARTLGSEVWIDGFNADGKMLDNAKIPLDAGWECNGRIFSEGDSTYSLNTVIKYKKTCSIIFVKHPYSGAVLIKTGNGKEDVIDLYSPTEEIFEYVVE
ncbi:MAG: hypothetical protein ACERKN_03655 [Velocimicrobium sp.]